MKRINSYCIIREDQHLLSSEDDVREFEQQIGFHLPGDYIHFLSKYGLSAGRDNVRFRNVNGTVEDESTVEVFYGFYPGDTYDLKDNWEVFGEDLPQGFLAIASCPGGQIVLALTGDEAGRIFWWAQHRGSRDPYDDLELLAYDFDSFVNTLTVFEE